MKPVNRIAFLLSLTLALFVSGIAYAQVPDTTYRKPELPTGPPAPTQQPRQQPKVIEKPQVVQPKQEVKPVQQAEDEQKELLDRLYYGGSFGLQFGTYTNISLLPILGYQVTEKFSIGTGPVYHFIRMGGQSLQNIGGRAFAQHEFLEGVIGNGAIVAHGEYEVLSVEEIRSITNGQAEKVRRTANMPMAGLGYRQRMGERASFDFLVLYNFNDFESPYSNPVIRAGFNIPFRR